MRKPFKPKFFYKDTKRYHICIANEMYYISFYGYGFVAVKKNHPYIMGWAKYSSAPKIIIGSWWIQFVRPFKYERWR